MDDNIQSPDNILVCVSPRGCKFCYPDDTSYDIYVSSVTSEVDGWTTKGRGEFAWPICECGAYYEAVMHSIPIHCAPFRCPKCGEDEHLKYALKSLTTDKQMFEFEVQIQCNKCHNKRSLSTLLRKVLEVVKLEVGPTGITIKKS